MNFSDAGRYLGKKLIAARVGLLALGHLTVFLCVYWLAFCLRFDFELPSSQVLVFWTSLPWVLSLKSTVFYFSGHFHGWWRYVTLADLGALLRATVLSVLGLAALDHFILPIQIPRSILLMDALISIVVLGGLRASFRMLREQFIPAFNQANYRRVLLVGADHSSGVLAHQIQSHSQLQYRIAGFLDINGGMRGSRLGGIPVLGGLEDVAQIAATQGAVEVLITSGSLSGARLRRLMEQCDQAGLNVKIVPRVEDRFNGNRQIPIRNVEINDLLRREPVQLDSTAIGTLVADRTILVTGAGGSIGSEICRQLLEFEPERMVMVGKGEHSIFTIDRELRRHKSTVKLVPCIADVTDERRMEQVFAQYRPAVIFHAAAHKHVPLMEANAGEAVKNNIAGTRCVAELADRFCAECFVLISTDKAVNPSSVMGASKNVAERYVLALSEISATRFVVTRFGNVLGSTGSVVPVFQDQIRHGGPITVTDPRMTRFFMSITEASQLVLQAAAMGKGGEIFVLDMGEPVKIVDLAHDLVRLSGLPEDSIELRYTGIRPGEKLHEELYFVDEHTLPTAHPKIRAAYHRSYLREEVSQAIDELIHLADGPDGLIREKLCEVVPEYGWGLTDGKVNHIGNGSAHPLNGQTKHAKRLLDGLQLPSADGWNSAAEIEPDKDAAMQRLG
jgi:FlaA1/EpsC-like NDP-sugar epimerase